MYNTKKTPDNEWKNERDVLNHETELRRCLRNRLNRSNKVGNKQHNNDETSEMTKEIQVSVLIKRDETFNKKKRDRSCHNSKETRIEIFVFNIYKTREITIYKELSRQLTLQEMNTIK